MATPAAMDPPPFAYPASSPRSAPPSEESPYTDSLLPLFPSPAQPSNAAAQDPPNRDSLGFRVSEPIGGQKPVFLEKRVAREPDSTAGSRKRCQSQPFPRSSSTSRGSTWQSVEHWRATSEAAALASPTSRPSDAASAPARRRRRVGGAAAAASTASLPAKLPTAEGFAREIQETARSMSLDLPPPCCSSMCSYFSVPCRMKSGWYSGVLAGTRGTGVHANSSLAAQRVNQQVRQQAEPQVQQQAQQLQQQHQQEQQQDMRWHRQEEGTAMPKQLVQQQQPVALLLPPYLEPGPQEHQRLAHRLQQITPPDVSQPDCTGISSSRAVHTIELACMGDHEAAVGESGQHSIQVQSPTSMDTRGSACKDRDTPRNDVPFREEARHSQSFATELAQQQPLLFGRVLSSVSHDVESPKDGAVKQSVCFEDVGCSGRETDASAGNKGFEKGDMMDAGNRLFGCVLTRTSGRHEPSKASQQIDLNLDL